MSDWTITLILGFGCVMALYIGRQALRSRTSYLLPPGPPGLPWVGNVIGINTGAPWITYAEWARSYGDIVYSRLLGKDIIIINSEKIAKELLENRSRNYSDRPYLTTNEMGGLYFNTVLLPYGDRWRLHRRFFHQTFRFDAVPRFLPYQHRKACNLLRRLLVAPDQLDDHVFEYTAAVIMNSTYNYDPASRKDEFVGMMANALSIVIPALRFDVAIIIGAFPLLLHLPSWFPGMTFKRNMAIARAFSEHYLERPFLYSLQRMSSGSVSPSMVHDALRHIEEKGISPEESWMEALKEASGTAFLAASETSHSVLMTFFLMMALNPAVQARAQAQIDAVMPFFWETLRYSPVAPLSAPHAAVGNDVYGGFHIPKGAILLANLWSMAHDEFRYPNSHAFVPERFLNDDGSLKPNDIKHIAFGFGRRICVGRHFAETSVWTAIAKVLAVFTILRPLDENGVEISMEPRFSSGVLVYPLPFRCRIVPRVPGTDAEKLEQLISARAA